MAKKNKLAPWVRGIDISKNQTIDWAKLDKSVKFVIIKATDGATYVDPSFAANWAAAGRRTKLKRGASHFFRPGADVDQQFALITQTVDLRPGDLPIAVDVENTKARRLTPADAPALAALLTRLRAGSGRPPIVYTNKSSWGDLGNPESAGDVAFGECPLWIAHYTTTPSPDYPHPWVQWLMWQHAETGRVAGVSYPVDVDRFNGTAQGLKRL